MHIRHVSIQNFRGIRELEWVVPSKIACLIGPGDSTKTTVLDAIDYALSSRWNITFIDSDFYDCDPSNDIRIRVTVGGLSTELLRDEKVSLALHGWSADIGVIDEPEDGLEEVITVQLSIDRTLEPQWTIYKDDNSDIRLSTRTRELFGILRIGTVTGRDFSWIKGTGLSKLTEDASGLLGELAEATRQIDRVITSDALAKASKKAENALKDVGARPKFGFQPKLDYGATALGRGAITLHDGEIPLTSAGYGTKRLFALGISLSQVELGGIALVDELETALEPYRIRHLLKHLKDLTVRAIEGTMQVGQVILTSVSGTVLVSLDADDLFCTRSEAGITTIKRVPADLQDVVRSVPEAFLSTKVLVCEGKTEYGIVKALDHHLQVDGEPSLAYHGVSYVEGGGDNAPFRAKQLASLHYEVAIFMDSDKETSPSADELTQCGVTVFAWSGNVNTETRVASDFSSELLDKLIKLRVEWGAQRNDVTRKLCEMMTEEYLPAQDWDTFFSTHEIKLRPAIAQLSNSEGWFKRVDKGEALGALIMESVNSSPATGLAKTIANLKEWLCQTDLQENQSVQPQVAERPST